MGPDSLALHDIEILYGLARSQNPFNKARYPKVGPKYIDFTKYPADPWQGPVGMIRTYQPYISCCAAPRGMAVKS